jgi:hypothetical protein
MKRKRNYCIYAETAKQTKELAGIKCAENPTLSIWRTQLGIERKLEIESIKQFIDRRW